MERINLLQLAFLGLLALLGLNSAYAYSSVNELYVPQLNEDQAIICVSGAVVNVTGLICHSGNIDDIDWYQDINDGSLFSLSDSFDMELVH